jgi:hypothetical protein
MIQFALNAGASALNAGIFAATGNALCLACAVLSGLFAIAMLMAGDL